MSKVFKTVLSRQILSINQFKLHCLTFTYYNQPGNSYSFHAYLLFLCIFLKPQMDIFPPFHAYLLKPQMDIFPPFHAYLLLLCIFFKPRMDILPPLKFIPFQLNSYKTALFVTLKRWKFVDWSIPCLPLYLLLSCDCKNISFKSVKKISWKARISRSYMEFLLGY